MSESIRWSFDQGNPVIAPGRIHGDLDAGRASSPHVIPTEGGYLMYYWGTGSDGYHRILRARSSREAPNEWTPLGSVLERQPDTTYNMMGPGFPYVVPREDGPWLLYFGAWGKPRESGRLANTTGVAVSHDRGATFTYPLTEPVLPLDRPWDAEGTGSVCVLPDGDRLRMYYTAIGEYSPKPEGVRTGHGDVIPRIGVGYAVSTDGINWSKPHEGLVVAPRGFATEPYEYIASKPFVMPLGSHERMWLNTFGTAYRLRSLDSSDGLSWRWRESGPEGEFGVGEPGSFDDEQRCYYCGVAGEDEIRCWYTGNGFGATGIGYAQGSRLDRPAHRGHNSESRDDRINTGG